MLPINKRGVEEKPSCNLWKNWGIWHWEMQSLCKLGSIYFNEGSSQAVYLATNSIVKVVKRVVSRELDSVVAIVRPSGYHAKQHDAMGFFLFNNVAVAARYLLDERPKLVWRKYWLLFGMSIIDMVLKKCSRMILEFYPFLFTGMSLGVFIQLRIMDFIPWLEKEQVLVII